MAAFDSFGTTISRGATAIGQVVGISFDGHSKEFIDTTHLTSTAKWRTFLSSMRDAGSLTCQVVYDPALASHILIYTDYVADATTAWTVVFSDTGTTTVTIDAGVSNFSRSANLGEALQMEFTLKLSGAFTEA